MTNLIGDGAVVREWSAHDEWCGFSLESGPCDCSTAKHNAAIRQQAAEIERLTVDCEATVNSLKAFQSALFASEARTADLLKALEKYGVHQWPCSKEPASVPCTCGLAAAKGETVL